MKLAAVLCAGALLLTGCRHDAEVHALVSSPSPSLTPSAAASPTPSPTPSPSAKPTPRPVPRAKPRPAATPAPRRTVVTPVATPKPSLPTCPSVPATKATQVLLVIGYGDTAAIRACQRRAGRWMSVLGTMYGHVGLNGVAPPGAKREGDRRTPSGVFTLGAGFGVLSDPGTWFPWHRVTRGDVWVDDPRSSLYNTRQRDPANGRWTSAENLYVPGTYDYVQVIDYNTARVPGLGSAIFLHVDHGSGTYGCVSIPRAQLLKVFHWEQAGAVIAIR